MRVVTIDGGFRGLADLSAASRQSALDSFLRRVQIFDDTWERFSALREAGEVSAVDEQNLARAYERLAPQLGAHAQQAQALSSDAALADWRRRGEALLQEAFVWVRRVRYVIGEGAANRGLRIALIAAASITLLGGGMYVLYRVSKRGRR